MNDSWKEYFVFSKKERIAVTILFALIAIFIALPFFYSSQKQPATNDEKLQQQIAQLHLKKENKANVASQDSDSNSQSYSMSENVAAPAFALFYFDPNTLNAEGWKHLGIGDKTIHTIQNYLSKGGQFKNPEDIRKIYGLKKPDADRLIPYVQIQSSQSTKNSDKKEATIANNYVITKKKISSIDINTATVDEWKALPGIGDVLSNRIIKFRNKIGSFTSIDDVKKTYGLSDSTFQIIRPYLTINSSNQK